MRNEPTLWRLEHLLKSVSMNAASKDGTHYYPARPLGYCPIPMKLKLVWGVWTGKYDVLEWPEGQ